MAEDVEDASAKACAISIIKDHAAVVSKFVARGRSEMRKNHDAPSICKSAPRKVDVDTLTFDPNLATTKVAAALATTTANSAAMNMDIRPGYVATILSSVLFAAKVMLF